MYLINFPNTRCKCNITVDHSTKMQSYDIDSKAHSQTKCKMSYIIVFKFESNC